ncbi:NAD(P)-dependent oxidoreductase [Plantactinospora sp. GCM10030261]|uniref:NAD(P)-dependent oxidoreductase n=1 Tax=Plantactinospora sp. GCM10030261 TaxID=3273420 RepID=UPI003620CFDD
MNPDDSTVGVVGLGAMGIGIAANLVRAGYPVIGFDPSTDSVTTAQQHGVTAATDVSTVATQARTAILVVVRTSEQVESVTTDLAAAGRPGLPVILASTIAPATARTVTDHLTAAGLRPISAALSGGPWGAKAGTLTFMVSGPPQTVRDCEPLFAAAGSRTFVVSDRPDVAQAAKLAVQLIYGVNMMGLFEAFRLGAAYGIDHADLEQIFRHSVADSWVARNWPHVREWWESNGNGLDILLKDMRAALREADDLALALPTTALTFDLMRAVWPAFGGSFPRADQPAPDPVAWT